MAFSTHIRYLSHLRPQVVHTTRHHLPFHHTFSPPNRPKSMPNLFYTETPLLKPNSPLVRHGFLRRTFATGPDNWSSFQSGRRLIWGIIGLNTVSFGAWQYAITYRDQSLYRKLNENFTLSLQNWKAGRVWTLVTSAMSHQMLYHLVFR